MQLVKVAWLRTKRAPQVNHKYNRAAVVGLVEDNVDRRVGYATAIPEELSVDAGAGETRRQRTAGQDVLGRQGLFCVIEEDQRSRLHVRRTDGKACPPFVDE